MYKHERSGLNLTLFRGYDPTIGRWLSRDPLGEGSDATRYSYCWNDPINGVDPLGLDALYRYGQYGGLHRGLFVVHDNGKVVIIDGGYTKNFSGNLKLNIREKNHIPNTDFGLTPIDPTPISTDSCKIRQLVVNALEFQKRLRERPIRYSVFVNGINEGRTSNQVIPLLLHSAGIPVPPEPIAPGYDVPFGSPGYDTPL